MASSTVRFPHAAFEEVIVADDIAEKEKNVPTYFVGTLHIVKLHSVRVLLHVKLR